VFIFLGFAIDTKIIAPYFTLLTLVSPTDFVFANLMP